MMDVSDAIKILNLITNDSTTNEEDVNALRPIKRLRTDDFVTNAKDKKLLQKDDQIDDIKYENCTKKSVHCAICTISLADALPTFKNIYEEVSKTTATKYFMLVAAILEVHHEGLRFMNPYICNECCVFLNNFDECQEEYKKARTNLNYACKKIRTLIVPRPQKNSRPNDSSSEDDEFDLEEEVDRMTVALQDGSGVMANKNDWVQLTPDLYYLPSVQKNPKKPNCRSRSPKRLMDLSQTSFVSSPESKLQLILDVENQNEDGFPDEVSEFVPSSPSLILSCEEEQTQSNEDSGSDDSLNYWLRRNRNRKKRKGLPDEFKCSECGFVSGKEYSLLLHYDSHHYQVVPYVCSVQDCNFKTSFQHSFKIHLNTFHETESEALDELRTTSKKLRKKFLHCKLCSSRFVESYHMKKHEDLHSTEETLTCKICSFKTIHSSVLYKHKHTNCGIKNELNCRFCSYQTVKTADLVKHYSTIHCELVNPDSNKTKKEPEEFSDEDKFIKVGKKLKCTVCSYSTTDKNAAFKHFDKNHLEDEFESFLCPMDNCIFATSNKKSLSKHLKMGIHSFNTSSEKNNDYQTKNKFLKLGDKDFKCVLCDFKRSNSYLVRLHYDYHHATFKPFICPVIGCEFSTPLKQSLERHFDTKAHRYKLIEGKQTWTHVDGLYKCGLCDFETYKRESILVHYDSKHCTFSTYKCHLEKCNYFTSAKENMKRHIKTKHKSLQLGAQEIEDKLKEMSCNSVDFENNGCNPNISINLKKLNSCHLCLGDFKTFEELNNHLYEHAMQAASASDDHFLTLDNKAFTQPTKKKKTEYVQPHSPMELSIPGYDNSFESRNDSQSSIQFKKDRDYDGNQKKWIKEGELHKCTLCEFTHQRRYCVRMHYDSHHMTTRPYVCEVENCTYSTAYKQSMERHVELGNHHFEEMEKVGINDEGFVYVKDEIYKCPDCDFSSIKRDVRRHYNSKHPKKSYLHNAMILAKFTTGGECNFLIRRVIMGKEETCFVAEESEDYQDLISQYNRLNNPSLPKLETPAQVEEEPMSSQNGKYEEFHHYPSTSNTNESAAKSSFMCTLCRKEFRSEEEIEKHITTVHRFKEDNDTDSDTENDISYENMTNMQQGFNNVKKENSDVLQL